MKGRKPSSKSKSRKGKSAKSRKSRSRRAKSSKSRKSGSGKGRKGGNRKKTIHGKNAPPREEPSPPPVEVRVQPKIRPKGTCIQPATPGPGEYAAPSTVGYYEHDPTKKREPAFTFSAASGRAIKKISPHSLTPGPAYNVSEMSRFGAPNQTGPVIIGRHPELTKGHLTPGPGHYSPEKYDLPGRHKAPEARLLGRYHEGTTSQFTPGPGNYKVPSSIGDAHPTYTSSPSARLVGRSWDKKTGKRLHFIPGPNQYDYDNSAFLKNEPQALLLGRNSNKTVSNVSPGPGAYLADYNQGRDGPSFSFGRKHAPCVVIPWEPDE